MKSGKKLNRSKPQGIVRERQRPRQRETQGAGGTERQTRTG